MYATKLDNHLSLFLCCSTHVTLCSMHFAVNVVFFFLSLSLSIRFCIKVIKVDK